MFPQPTHKYPKGRDDYFIRIQKYLYCCCKDNLYIKINENKLIEIYDRDSLQNIIIIDLGEPVLNVGDFSYNEFYSISSKGVIIWELKKYTRFIKLKKIIPLKITIDKPVLAQINARQIIISMEPKKCSLVNLDDSTIIRTYSAYTDKISKICSFLYFRSLLNSFISI